MNTFVQEPCHRMAAIERSYQLSYRISTFSPQQKKKKRRRERKSEWKKSSAAVTLLSEETRRVQYVLTVFSFFQHFLELKHLRKESCKYFTDNQSIQNPTEGEIVQTCSDKSTNARTTS